MFSVRLLSEDPKIHHIPFPSTAMSISHKNRLLECPDQSNSYLQYILCTCKFLAERLSSIRVSCPLTVDVAATRALLPWIKAEA